MENREEKKDSFIDPAAVAKKLHVPTYDEILDRIKSRYPKSGKTLFDRELARLQTTYDILLSKTNFIRTLTWLLDSLHPFYWKLIEIDFNKKRIHNAITCVSKSRKISRKLFEKYRVLLMAASSRKELIRVSSEGRGRILSTIKKCRKDLDYLRNLIIFIQHLPTVDPTLFTLIIAGAPSTGKSTLVRALSRAQPQVASYPFTTRQIHIGHRFIIIKNKKVKIQIIDTPGLLDRPFNEMNPVEKRAVAALSLLPGVVIFLVDPSEDSYMNIEEQFNLLNNILKINNKIFIGINKIDISPKENINKAKIMATKLLQQNKILGYEMLVANDKESSMVFLSKIINIVL